MPTLRWLGHAAFTLAADDKVVAIDPFLTGNPAAASSAADLHPTTILLTHGHDDHVGDTLAIATRSGAPVIAIVEVARWLAAQGIETQEPNYGGTVAFDGGTVKLVPACHTSSAAGAGTLGQPAGLVVRFGGQTLYFAGDTGLFLDMQLIGDEALDVAVLPIGDYYTMGPADAVRAVKFLRPRYVVPCHYNTFPAIQQDAAAFKRQVEAETHATVVILQPGEEWEIGS